MYLKILPKYLEGRLRVLVTSGIFGGGGCCARGRVFGKVANFNVVMCDVGDD